MPVFEYVGIDRQQKRAAGIIEAESDKAARMKLRKMGVYPRLLNLEGTKKKVSLKTDIDLSKFTQRIKTQDIALMTRQLATLVSAGIPLVDALTALLDQTENPKMKTILSQVREKVTAGTKLSDAMRAHPKVFSDIYFNMVNAGENSGTLDLVLNRLADFTEGQARLRSKVMSAMMYPVIMSVVGFALIILLMVGVIPKITSIFEDVQATLPLPTKILIAISSSLSKGWVLISLVTFIALSIYGLRKWRQTEKGRLFFDRRALKLPLFGKLNRMVAISRFARTLGTLLNSGVPLLVSLGIVRNIVTNVVIRQVIETTAKSVQEGATVADPLRQSGEFPPLVTHMIAIGEKTGELEKMLDRVADTYDNQVENVVSALTTLLEPVMILVMAGVVAFIVMSVLMPILELNQLGG